MRTAAVPGLGVAGVVVTVEDELDGAVLGDRLQAVTTLEAERVALVAGDQLADVGANGQLAPQTVRPGVEVRPYGHVRVVMDGDDLEP